MDAYSPWKGRIPTASHRSPQEWLFRWELKAHAEKHPYTEACVSTNQGEQSAWSAKSMLQWKSEQSHPPCWLGPIAARWLWAENPSLQASLSISTVQAMLTSGEAVLTTKVISETRANSALISYPLSFPLPVTFCNTSISSPQYMGCETFTSLLRKSHRVLHCLPHCSPIMWLLTSYLLSLGSLLSSKNFIYLKKI